MNEKVKEIIAVEIYRRVLSSFSAQSLKGREKYLTVEFDAEDGSIERISFGKERNEGESILSVEVGGAKNGKELFERIRNSVEKTELRIDTKIWNMIGNAYDWAFWGER